MTVYLISVHFGFHLYFINNFFFVLSFICIFNLSINLFNIYLFIYISTFCMFIAMTVYLIFFSFWVSFVL